MVVLGEDTIASVEETITTVPHEFFHAVQHACESFEFVEESAWWWEATAIWMENQVYPDDSNYAVFLFGFAFYPHYALNFFDYFDTGAVQEYYSYGAFVFPTFLTDFYVGPEVIRDSWVLSSASDDPLRWMQAELAGQGLDFAEVFADFSAHNVHWDYPHQAWYVFYLDYYAEMYSQDDHQVTDVVTTSSLSEWREPPDALWPQAFGANTLVLEALAEETLHVYVDGEEWGSQGSEVNWRATAIRKSGEEITYIPLSFSGSFGEAELGNLTSSEELSLSVVPFSDTVDPDEVFAYSYAFSTIPMEPLSTSKTASDTGCGCQSTQWHFSGWSCLLLALFWRRSSAQREHISGDSLHFKV